MGEDHAIRLWGRRREALWVSAIQSVVGAFLVVSGICSKKLFDTQYDWTSIYDTFATLCYLAGAVVLVIALIGFLAHGCQGAKLACVFCAGIALEWILALIA